jgi:hypothetical protein
MPRPPNPSQLSFSPALLTPNPHHPRDVLLQCQQLVKGVGGRESTKASGTHTAKAWVFEGGVVARTGSYDHVRHTTAQNSGASVGRPNASGVRAAGAGQAEAVPGGRARRSAQCAEEGWQTALGRNCSDAPFHSAVYVANCGIGQRRSEQNSSSKKDSVKYAEMAAHSSLRCCAPRVAACTRTHALACACKAAAARELVGKGLTGDQRTLFGTDSPQTACSINDTTCPCPG